MSVTDTLREIRESAGVELAQVQNTAALEALRVKVLGKKGDLTALLKGLGGLPAEERPAVGAQINEARAWLTGRMDEALARLQAGEREAALAAETIDVTEPRPMPGIGASHPVTLVMNDLIECFTGMGFEVMQGPEVELDHYNFELMNIPKNHPARDAQDTFYIDDNVVLRTHTSPMQARAMLTRKPPIRIVCPGRCYRADEVDATHSPVFHQMEGLVVDEHVTMADLRGTLTTFARHMYGPDVEIRFRPSFFPFTEPSAEVDLTCPSCRGKGCRVCKETGWVEILGSGMVNPKVLEMCGIDSRKYSGFAFGVGLERLAMRRYGIRDMRLLYEGDARLFGQLR
jgi:phenylalanyl-tRNA synthetase alpha chain